MLASAALSHRAVADKAILATLPFPGSGRQGALCPTTKTETPMSKLRLTFACGPYDRTQALRDGTLQPEGIDLNYLALQTAEIFWRMLQYQEFDASEMSLSNYTTLVSEGNSPFIAVPAFPSRVFRHGYFFINTGKGITSGADLKGKRGGVPFRHA